MKKGLLIVAGLACLLSSPLHAYKYRVANLTESNLYIDLRGAAKGTLFEGNRNASDSWKIKDYDMIPAKSTKNYSFVGIYCIDAIRVGTSPSNLAPMPIHKSPADVKAFNETVETITIISNTAKEWAGKIPEYGDVAQILVGKLINFIDPLAGLASNWLCFDMTFFVGINPYKATNTYGGLYDYVIISQQGLTDTSKFTGITANLDEPQSLPDTPFWTRIKDSIITPAKTSISSSTEAVGADVVKKTAKETILGKDKKKKDEEKKDSE